MKHAPITCHFDPHALRARVAPRFGFVTEADVEALAQHPVSRLWPCLVRCGGCRFTAPAQDVARLIELIERPNADGSPSDYVRDVALLPISQATDASPVNALILTQRAR